MIDELLQIVAPHYCYNCQKQGSLLCANCKYDITLEPFAGCIVCRNPCWYGICVKCRTFYQKAWCVGERHDELERLINGYKFERVQAAHKVFADLLHATLSVLPPDTVVTSIPTIPAHIRERGYDHMTLIARRFARLRNLPYKSIIQRTDMSKQRGASRRERFAQAKNAFRVVGEVDITAPYLVLDDVVTTGATLQYAAKALGDAGIDTVWVAAIARQPLDKSA